MNLRLDLDNSFAYQFANRIIRRGAEIEVHGEADFREKLAQLGEPMKVSRLRVSGQSDSVPEEIGAFRKLRVLILQIDPTGAGALKLPDALSELSNLQFLAISTSRLAALPASVTELPRLQALDLNAKIDDPELMSCVARIKELRHFHAPYEHLGSPGSNLDLWSVPLPAAFSALHELISFQAGGITQLPDSIGDKPALQKLTIQGSFEKLPADLAQLRALVKLDLRGRYRELPQNLATLPVLESLTLRSGRARVEMAADTPGTPLTRSDLEWAIEQFGEEIRRTSKLNNVPSIDSKPHD